MTDKIHIDVYLSYRSHHKTQLQHLIDSAESYNEDNDSKYYINVKASESELKKGDSIYEFMEELSAARFVLLMQTQDYFQSPYCLHELLEIHENGDAEQRILPISIKPDSTVHNVTTDLINDYLEDDFLITETGETGNCLSRLKELQQDAGERPVGIEPLKERIQKAYEVLVKEPLIYTLEKETENILQIIIERAESIFEEEKRLHHEYLTENIQHQIHELEEKDKKALMLEMGKRFDDEGRDESMANYLLDQSVDEAMKIMQKWVGEVSNNTTDSFEWRLYFRKAEIICGWLLLNTIDNNWWVHNRINLLKRCRDKNQISLGINKPAYAEVVIGRTLKQAAMFSLDDYHNPIPQAFEDTWNGFDDVAESNKVSFKNDFVIDASSSAQEEELLKPLIYDLKQKPPKISDSLLVQVNELVDEIKASSKEQVFYLVTERYHQRLKNLNLDGSPILQKINTELKEKLVFISFGSPDYSTRKVSHDENVLTQFATILRTDKTRKQGSN